MSKFTAYLASLVLLLCSLTASAQDPSFSFLISDPDPTQGEIIDAHVVVDNFTDLVGFQFSVNWDETDLDYQGVTPTPDLLGFFISNFGTTQTSQGVLVTSWSDPTLTGQSLAAGDTLFTISFEVLASTGTSTLLEFSSSPLAIEFTNSSFMVIPVEMNNLSLDLNGGGSGNPGNGAPDCTFSGFGINVEQDSADTGEQICLDFYVCNFTDIVSMQYTMEFNPAVLQFDSIAGINLTDMEAGNFGTTNVGNGFITLSWNDDTGTGITVPDQTAIYSVCFTAVGAGGEMDTLQITGTPLPIEVTDAGSGSMHIGLESAGGEILITGTSSSAVTVEASCETASPGDTVTVDVTVKNFNDMLGLQYSMGWDETILDFHEIINPGVLIGATFNTTSTLTDDGKFTLTWNDPMGTGVTLSDNTIIYQVRYIVTGSPTDVSAVEFTADPTSIEAIQNVSGMGQVVPLSRVQGKVEVVGAGVLNINLSDETGCTGDTVAVCVTVDNFNEISSMQYDVSWDDSHLTYLGVDNFNLNGLTSAAFNPTGNTLRISWIEPLVNPLTLANGTQIYCMNFEILGADGTSSNVTFLDNPPANPVEIAGSGGVVTDYVLNGNTVSVSCVSGGPLEITDATVTDVACNGELTGAIDITVGGGSGSYTYSWSNSAVSQDLSGIGAATYSVTVSDGMNSVTGTYTVSQPTALSATINKTDVACNGDATGEATAVPAGGTAGYSYLWSNTQTTPTISGLTAGMYSVTVTDANMCTTVASVTINQPDALSATASVNSNVSCNGGSDGEVTVNVTGGTGGYSFAWSNSGATATISGLSAGTFTVTVTDGNMCTTTASATVTEPSLLVATASSTDIDCNGNNNGTATVNTVGGTPGYSFLWSNMETTPMINGLAPGNYSVTVTDANMCTSVSSTVVNEPPAISISGAVTDETGVDANDGTITLTVTGGTGNPTGFTYSWDLPSNQQNLTNLMPGNYTVTVTDDNNCSETATFTVNAFDAPMITVDNVTNVSCNGGSDGAINISVSGGVMPYNYNWSGPSFSSMNEDISGLSSGIYTVTVTDGIGTTAVETVTVTEPTAIMITIDQVVGVTCPGDSDGSISISVSGGTPGYTYAWSNSANTQDLTGLAGGNYTLTVTDNNSCTATVGPINVAEPDPITITVDSTVDPVCNGDETGSVNVTVTGGTLGYTYLWTGGAVTQDLSGAGAGTYTLAVTDSRGCVQVSNPITLNEPSAISVNISSGMVSCFGFSDGFINLSTSGGTPGYTYNWSNGLPPQPNQANLPAGSYSVTVTDAASCTTIIGPIDVTQPSELILTNSVTNATEANDDGAINLSVSGGTPGYTYAWSNSAITQDISGLASGCYVVTVTDGNGCIAEDSIKVGGIMVITADITDVSCFGGDDGAIDITVTGGIEPYTYTWDVEPSGAQDQSVLVAGTYGVTVADASGNVASASFTVGTPTAMTITNSVITNETGNGCNGSIDISVSGGVLPYTFQWSNGMDSEDIDDLCKGDYSVVIIDANGCVLLSPEFTIAPPPLVVANSSVEPVSCNNGDDGQACVSILGGCGPYTFDIGVGNPIIDVDGDNICFDDLSAGNYMITITDNEGTSVVHSLTIDQPSPILVLVTGFENNTDPDCINPTGSINITVSGGTAPYNYNWSNNFPGEDPSGLCHGSYSVTVTDDNNCISILSGLNLQLGLNVQAVEVTDVTCFGDCDGAIDIEVTGGTTPYIYNWSNGPAVEDPINLCAGQYTVTVTDANGISVVSSPISVNSPTAALAINTVEVIQPLGDNNDGSIDISPVGGWGGYTYNWSNNSNGQDLFGIGEGTYSVTVTDENGCQESAIYTLNALRLTLNFQMEEPSCNGFDDGLIEVFVEGGSGDYTYEWSTDENSPGIFNLTSGNYSVTVTDVNNPVLSATADVTLGEPAPIVANILVSPSSGAADGTLQAVVEGGTAPYTYLWAPGQETVATISDLGPGIYGLRVEDSNGCVEIINQIEVPLDGECLQAKEIISANGDGQNEEFIINCIEKYENTLSIFNRWGQRVYETTNYDNTWNGVDQDGNLLPEDGYFYVLEYIEGGETIQIKGAITVLR